MTGKQIHRGDAEDAKERKQTRIDTNEKIKKWYILGKQELQEEFKTQYSVINIFSFLSS